MTPRDIRRAVERQTRKAARKAGFPIAQSISSAAVAAPEETIDPAVLETPTPEPRVPPPSAISPRA